jgi:hypothetical protein
VAVGRGNSQSNSILYGDGSNWSNALTGGFKFGVVNPITTGNCVAYNNGLWVAGGFMGTTLSVGGSNVPLYSTDGCNWYHTSNILMADVRGVLYKPLTSTLVIRQTTTNVPFKFTSTLISNLLALS